MSHKISNNLKGALGEIFTKNEFADYTLIDLTGNMSFTKLPGMPKEPDWPESFNDLTEKEENKFFKECDKIVEEQYKKLELIYGTGTLPDYFVKHSKVFLEVKTGKSAKLEDSQKEGFQKLLEKGFRVFIIKPNLLIEKFKFELLSFDCYEFLDADKKKKTTISEIKKIISDTDF